MRAHARLLLLVLVVGVFAPASLAAGEANALRLHLGYFSPTSDLAVLFDDTIGKVEYQGALGVGADYEFRLNELIGLDFGLQYFQPDVEFKAGGLVAKDTGRFVPWTGAVLFHVVRTPGLDFYLGPELAYVMYGDVAVVDVGAVEFKNELTVGGKLGIDVPFSPRWSFNAGLEYIDAKSETDVGAPNVEFNPKPLIFTAGATYKF